MDPKEAESGPDAWFWGVVPTANVRAFFTCTQYSAMVLLTPEVSMAAAYSMDLRERVIADADAGLASKELAARYRVSLAWVNALKQRRRETGSIAPRKQ